jgi:hypothetical protein
MMSALSKHLMISLFIVELMGCATNIPKTPDYFATEYQSLTPVIRRVVLVTDLTPPQIESVDLGFTRGEGAAAGAAGGAAAGVGVSLDMLGGCSGDFCGAAFILLLPVFVLGGAIVGTVSGAGSGYSADMLAEAEANAQQMLNAAYLQAELIEYAQDYGQANVDLEFIRKPGIDPAALVDKPDYAALANESIDVVLEVELLRLTLEYSLEMEARARLISVQTGVVLSDSQYSFSSEHHRLDEWMASGAAPLSEAIQRGLHTLAEDIMDEKFLLFYPHEPEKIIPQQAEKTSEQAQISQDKHVPHYVLGPVYPALDTCIFCERPFSKRPHRAIGSLEFVEVASVQPTLQWERFPRDHDRIDADGQYHQISNVRYDLRVFDAAIPSSTNIVLVPARQVYDARDISEPYHKIESGLNACSDYFWTVRARFRLDGQVRVTEWAGAFDVAGWSEKPWNLRRGLLSYKQPPDWLAAGLTGMRPPVPDGPEWFYYPFRTPCNTEKPHKPEASAPEDPFL